MILKVQTLMLICCTFLRGMIMKKIIFILAGFFLLSAGNVFSQNADDSFFSDEMIEGESGAPSLTEDFSSSDDAFFSNEMIEGNDASSPSDDDFFSDDGIVDFTGPTSQDTSLNSAPSSKEKNDLSHGVLFENGSIKIGGKFSTSLSTSTTLYKAPAETESTSSESDDTSAGDLTGGITGSDGSSTEGASSSEETFSDRLKDTTLTPTADATFTIDARPSQTLRMYSKFQVSYPFTSANISSDSFSLSSLTSAQSLSNVSASDVFSVKELFTDFSFYDRAFFRFGLHTVSWGAGLLYSPVSDMINTSSIDIMNYTEAVSPSFNLRGQIIFPGSMNALYFYLIPDSSSTSAKLIDTALAAKYEWLAGGWEFGAGAFYKYQSPFKLMFTASGSIKKFGLFAEAVYQFGSESEWNDSPDSRDDKTNIFQLTAGTMYYWKDPSITFIGQYYYDGNKDDLSHKYFTKGHNLAAVVSFGQIAGNSDWSASLIGIMNVGHEKMTAEEISSSVTDEEYGSLADRIIEETGGEYTYYDSDGTKHTGTYTREQLIEVLKDASDSGSDTANSAVNQATDAVNSILNTLTLYAAVTYSPNDYISVSAGPYLTFSDWGKAPNVYFQMKVSLGGGKF